MFPTLPECSTRGELCWLLGLDVEGDVECHDAVGERAAGNELHARLSNHPAQGRQKAGRQAETS